MKISELDDLYTNINMNPKDDKSKYFEYKRNVKHSDSFFSDKKVKFMSSFGISIHPLYSLPDYHSHSYLEMMYVTRGSFVNVVEGEQFILKKGDIFFIPPGVYHSVDTADGIVPEECVLLNIHIEISNGIDTFKTLSDSNPISKYVDNVFCAENYPKYAHIKCLECEKLDTLMRLLHSFYLERRCKIELNASRAATFRIDALPLTSSDYDMCSRLLCMVIEFAAHDGVGSVSISNATTKSAVPATLMLEYIKANCENVTLEDVAEKFNYSFSYTSKMVKQLSGVGFAKLITQFKLEKACEMLRNTVLPVQEIAFQTGYHSIEHFHRTFKDEFGITPAQYRKNK